jgi:hypothetical protein
MDLRDLENGMNKRDAHDTDGADVAEMLSSLPRVSAPENFAFRVKARIAERAAPRGRLIPFLKLAAPLGLVLFIVAFGAFYLTSRTGNEVVAGNEASIRNERASASSMTEAPAPRTDTVSEPGRVESPAAAEPQRASVEKESSDPAGRKDRAVRITNGSKSTSARHGGGSRDEALGSAKTINPRGMGGEILLRDVFLTLGLTADFDNGGWKIKSAADGGPAHRSGIRSGDVIEAIDGKELTESTSFKGSFNGKVFRVRRDGKTISVDLKN